MKTRLLLALALLVVVSVFAYWNWAKPAPLGEADWVLVGDLANRTGDANFDDALRAALRRIRIFAC